MNPLLSEFMDSIPVSENERYRQLFDDLAEQKQEMARLDALWEKAGNPKRPALKHAPTRKWLPIAMSVMVKGKIGRVYKEGGGWVGYDEANKMAGSWDTLAGAQAAVEEMLEK